MKPSLWPLFAALLGTAPVPVILRYGTVSMLMGYLTVFLTVLMGFGLRWLWMSAPTASSARAVRTLLRMLWTMSGVLASVASAAWLVGFPEVFWLLPLPFVLPALVGVIVYEGSFRKVDDMPFWRRGL